MALQYFVARDEETNKVNLIGRFVDGVPEIYRQGKWKFNSFLTSLHQDGLLQYITEAEADKLILEKNSEHLQAA